MLSIGLSITKAVPVQVGRCPVVPAIPTNEIRVTKKNATTWYNSKHPWHNKLGLFQYNNVFKSLTPKFTKAKSVAMDTSGCEGSMKVCYLWDGLIELGGKSYLLGKNGCGAER